MIVYFDTSALVPILIEEPCSLAAALLWDEADRVISSRVAYAEARAALAMARRSNRVNDDELRKVVDDFELLHEQLDIVEVNDRLIRDAGSLADQFGLRAYDAVHLASARVVQDPDLVLAAGDQNLLRAAQGLGFAM
ncbi:MAG: type II toxin-antitoxin system VapC family toxin [Actinobacteria bacterium]|nr:type II toxin-antitoxin system VapC family toxin [Actinomycetota bacterium]